MSKQFKNSQDRRNRKAKRNTMTNYFTKAMIDYKNGVLKDENNKPIVEHSEAIAYGMRKSGVSYQDIRKAELRNKLVVCKGQLQFLLKKEERKDDSLEKEILKLFRLVKNPTDSDIHGLAVKLRIEPSQVEDKIYEILKSFLAGGTSKGDEGTHDSDEVAMGMIVEAEHTADPVLIKKIVNDHLTENPKYYSEGKEKGMFPELDNFVSKIEKNCGKKNLESKDKGLENVDKGCGKKVKEGLSPGKGMEPKGARQLQHVYESCRSGGGNKEVCSKQAWATVKRSGYKSLDNDESKEFQSLSNYLEDEYLSKRNEEISKPKSQKMDIE